MEYIMGIDLGTTGCKASLFDSRGRLAAQAYREYPVGEYTGCIDGRMAWEKAGEVIRECCAVQNRVQAVCVTSFGETVVLVDREKRVLCDSFLYTEGGVDDEWRELEQKVGKERIHEITGHISHPMYTVSRLIWYRKNHPGLYARADQCLFFSSYIAMCMGARCVTEDTHAARSMAYDVKNGCWSKEILSAAEISGEKLPPIVKAGEIIGRMSEECRRALGFANVPLIISGGQDQPCVALGMGAVRGGDAVYGLGTVECLSVVLDQYRQTEQMRQNHLVCAPHVVPGKYLTYGVLYSGGNVIRELRNRLYGGDGLLDADRQQLYTEMFDGLRESDRELYFVPHLFGAGTPRMNQREGAGIHGLRPDTTRQDILRAALEGLAFDMRINIENMRNSGIEVSRIRAAGGGAKSEQAMQIRADALDQELYLQEDVQAGARGVFFIAAKTLGWIQDYSEAAQYVDTGEHMCAPREEWTECYRRKYEKYREWDRIHGLET